MKHSDATGRATLALRLERYEFAARRLHGLRVLDIACGVGYGTRLLADRSPPVVPALGVDRPVETIACAARRYGGDRVEFVAADAMRFTDREPFDTIVSLETIEHLPDPRGFGPHVVELLGPGGAWIASVPTTPATDANPLAVATRQEARMQSMRRNLPACYLAHPVSLMRRLASTLRDGFVNRYLTIAWKRSRD
jgi:2-polyprenyl-3-methyl-5-hydroxy-6-metoxy-1,4-benzoquinol methylase